ncbi:flagellar motor switch protein FliG, partial [Marinomonas sp. 42_23_T18]
MSDTEQNDDLTSLQKAAVLLMSLGESDAAQILKHMGPKEVQKIGQSMAQLANVQRHQVEKVLDDFLVLVGDQTGLGLGADGYIRNMLKEALGEEKAGSLIDRILLGGNTTGLDTLKWMEPRAVADVIRYEHPQIQAIVISYLDSDQAAGILSNFDERVRLDIVLRVASLETVQPAALQELNTILERQFSGSQGSQSTNIGGVRTAANIMNFIDSSVEADLMESIRDVDEDLANTIQDMMFVFDNLIDVDDRGIQAILREVESETLILALKGADPDMQEKIYKNMSSRAADMLKDDLDAKGPVRVSEVEVAQKEILAI